MSFSHHPKKVPNYYSTLGIDSKATLQEIKDAFRKLALAHHPDTQAANAKSSRSSYQRSAIFHEVHAAYDVLNDPAKRHIYDRKLNSSSQEGHPSTPTTQWDGYQRMTPTQVEHMVSKTSVGAAASPNDRMTSAEYHAIRYQSRTSANHHRIKTFADRKLARQQKVPSTGTNVLWLLVPLAAAGIWTFSISQITSRAHDVERERQKMSQTFK